MQLNFNEWLDLCIDYMNSHNQCCADIPVSYHSDNGYFPGKWLKEVLLNFDNLTSDQRLDLILTLHVCPASSNVNFADVGLGDFGTKYSHSLIYSDSQYRSFLSQYEMPKQDLNFVGVLVARKWKVDKLYCYFRSLDGGNYYKLMVFPIRDYEGFSPQKSDISFKDDVINGMVFDCSVSLSRTGFPKFMSAVYLGFCSSCSFWNSYFNERIIAHQNDTLRLQKNEAIKEQASIRRENFLELIASDKFCFINIENVSFEQLANLLTMFREEEIADFFHVKQTKLEKIRRSYGIKFTKYDYSKWRSCSIPIDDLACSLNAYRLER